MSPGLAGFSDEIVTIVNRTAPSIVAVHGNRRFPSSGVHWRKGLVVTSEQAIRKEEEITLSVENGKTTQATLVGRDAGTDLALLRADLDLPVVDHTTEVPRVGDFTLITGRSPNSGPNAALGIISAVSGPWRTWRGGHLGRYIRLDATLYDGSEGGAVLHHSGSVLGIATGTLSRVAGLAIPATDVNRIVDLLLEKGSIPRPYLGVGLQSVPLPESFTQRLSIGGTHGTMVLSLEKDGPAEKAGIFVGDILFELDSTPTGDVGDIQTILAPHTVGKSLKARIIRGGELAEATITIGERQDRGRS